MTKLRLILAAIVATGMVLQPIPRLYAQNIVEFPVPTVSNPVLGSIPTGITAGPDGNI
jgi:hypothetical protein